MQNTKNQTPVYRLLSETGPDHDKVFIIGVYVDEQLCAQGRGYSKQAAQQAAAQQVLEKQGIKLPILEKIGRSFQQPLVDKSEWDCYNPKAYF